MGRSPHLPKIQDFENSGSLWNLFRGGGMSENQVVHILIQDLLKKQALYHKVAKSAPWTTPSSAVPFRTSLSLFYNSFSKCFKQLKTKYFLYGTCRYLWPFLYYTSLIYYPLLTRPWWIGIVRMNCPKCKWSSSTSFASLCSLPSRNPFLGLSLCSTDVYPTVKNGPIWQKRYSSQA